MKRPVKKGYATEVFTSIQGEGVYVGVMQVFLRLSGCSLGCCYCDTPGSAEVPGECIIRGKGSVEKLSNPVDAAELAGIAITMIRGQGSIHSLSITGGEPLEQPEFLVGFLDIFKSEKVPVYLETNGLEEDAARQIAPLVDIISMDIKLPSLCGGGQIFGIYEKVLPVFGLRNLFCKVVIADGFDMEEFLDATRLVAGYNRKIPFIIQPATEAGGCCRVSPDILLECYRSASGFLDDVRVIPQCHQIMGLP